VTKEAARHLVRKKRASLEPDWIAEASRSAQERLAALPAFGGASVVFCYLALEREVQTAWFVAECLRLGKTVGVPCRHETDGDYAVACLEDDTELRTVSLGLREPVAPRWIPVDRIDLAVVPGVAFDLHGGRVGHGAGHYDRLLGGRDAGRAMAATKVGLTFEFQLMGRVDTARHDVDMDWVVTEERRVRCSTTAADKRERGIE
jgi:5-formyltetrahydrofolate cyclo-ligase